MTSSDRRIRIFVGILILKVFHLVPLVSSVCDSPWIQLDDACYYVSPNEQSEQVSSWHESQNWCLQNGGYLVTIEDIDERRLITNLTQEGIYDGAMWIGLNKLEDRINYKWSDGSTSEFRDWAMGEPDGFSYGMCVYQLTDKEDCFTRDLGISTTAGLFNNPNLDSPPNTFYFGYIPGFEDAASNECRQRCSAEPPCYSYTYISDSSPYTPWNGECMGRSNLYNVSEPDGWAISGVRYNCSENGFWHEGNCGEQRGFICKKAVNTTSTPSPTKLPTPTVPGFCPAGYIDGGGNKCFKIVVKTSANGVTWDEALDLCRAEPGIASDLASILSEYENAAITMYLRDESWGFWIGLRQSDAFNLQWFWTDNHDVIYSNWAIGEPTLNEFAQCTELWTHYGPAGTWSDLECEQQRGYICQTYKDANSIIVTPPTTPAHSCKTDYYNYGGICYRKITSGSSWSSALATCEADGATLATIHNEAENSALYVFGSDIAPFWIGYHKNENDEWVWTDGWPDLYSNWNVGEEPGTGGGCTSFKDNGKWKDDQCNNTLAAICMISTATVPTTPAPVEGVCPSSDWVDFGSYCYYFSAESDTLNFQMAMVSCDSKAGLYTTGNLVSIHSPAENQFIYEQLRPHDLLEAWIGLTKEAQGSPHKWSDGTELDYIRWAPGEPNGLNGTQQCVEMFEWMWPGMWNDLLCNDYRAYVCKALKVAQPSTPVMPAGYSCSAEDSWQGFGDYCYYMDIVQQLTFKEAQEECVQIAGSHAELVTIRDAYTNLFLMEMVAQVTTNRVQIWIGLIRANGDEEFRWIDNIKLNFTNWDSGQPTNNGNEHCAELHSDTGVWNYMNCETNRRPFICQVKKEYMDAPTDVPNSGIYLSGELAGFIISTMLALIAITGVGWSCVGSSVDDCHFPIRRSQMEQRQPADTICHITTTMNSHMERSLDHPL